MANWPKGFRMELLDGIAMFDGQPFSQALAMQESIYAAATTLVNPSQWERPLIDSKGKCNFGG
jgi:hypothetical protein